MTTAPSPTEAELLRTYLANRSIECPGCGYDLRALTSNRCPECAQPLVLRVGLEFPRMRLWVAGLIGLAAGAGMNGLLLIYAAIQLVRRGKFDVFDRFVVYNLFWFFVLGGPLLLWLLYARRIRRWGTGTRMWLCVACCVLTAIDIVGFSYLIR